MPTSEAFILLDQVSRIHPMGAGPVRALDSVSLGVRASEFLAVVGVSGSGKSTLLHLIGGLDRPTSGSIVVAGSPLQDHSSYERSRYRRRMTGFVFQSFQLVPSMTAAANVAVALTLRGIYGSERKERVAKALAQVGLAHRHDHRPAQLSGGEQQRVSLARALVHRPPLLLADEPTGNLDRATAAEVMQILIDAQRQQGTTVILVTHDEETAQRIADRVIRLRDGRIVSER